MDIHKKRLTPKGREEMVRAVVDGGMTKDAAARKFNTTPKTVPPSVALALPREIKAADSSRPETFPGE